MRRTLIGLLLLLAPAAASAAERVYEGSWLTTTRRLDGTMICAVTDLGEQRWRGHFHGVWQGQPFSYQVDFKGPPEKLRGTAWIDGADYEWTGEMVGGKFTGTFWGSRYRGSFNLEQVK